MVALLAWIGMPGPVELIIIAAIVLLLFGNRLPGAMRSLGRGVVEFKKGIQGIDEDVEEAVDPKSKKERKAESTSEQ